MNPELQAHLDALTRETQALRRLLAQEASTDTSQPDPSILCPPMPDADPASFTHLQSLCRQTASCGDSGRISYMGVFSSCGRQSNWMRLSLSTDELLTLAEDGTAGKVLSCIGSPERLRILMALLRRPMNVADLMQTCALHSTGQAYHHLKPLLISDLVAEEGRKGVYALRPERVQGLMMFLAGLRDLTAPEAHP